MQRITIEVADDGAVSVSAESPGEQPESMQFKSVDEALGAVRELLSESEMNEDPKQAWNEEADRRTNERAQMRLFE